MILPLFTELFSVVKLICCHAPLGFSVAFHFFSSRFSSTNSHWTRETRRDQRECSVLLFQQTIFAPNHFFSLNIHFQPELSFSLPLQSAASALKCYLQFRFCNGFLLLCLNFKVYCDLCDYSTIDKHLVFNSIMFKQLSSRPKDLGLLPIQEAHINSDQTCLW